MNLSLRKLRFQRSLAAAVFFVLAIPVGLAVIFTIWLTATAAYENIKFVRCTDQLLSFIGTARAAASGDVEFGQKADEDLVDGLLRRGQLPGQPANSWDGALRAQITTPPFIRVETDVPMAACRRLALFFGKDANALKLAKIEAHEENKGWATIYDAEANGVIPPDYRIINAACGSGDSSTFSVTLRLR